MRRRSLFRRILPFLVISAQTVCAQSLSAPDTEKSFKLALNLSGVYQTIPNGTTLPGDRKNIGSPEEVLLLPGAAEQIKKVDLKDDPAKWCQPVGPFRMMARDETKIEIVPATSGHLSGTI